MPFIPSYDPFAVLQQLPITAARLVMNFSLQTWLQVNTRVEKLIN